MRMAQPAVTSTQISSQGTQTSFLVLNMTTRSNADVIRRRFVRKSTKSARPYISRDQLSNSSTSTPAEVKPKVFAEPEWGPASSSKERSHTPDWFYPSRWKPTSERRRQSSTRYDGGEDERTSLADSDQPLCDPAQGRPERTENAANITGQPNKKPVKGTLIWQKSR